MGERVAVLLDGEFVRMVLGRRLKRFPTADEIMAEVERILKEPSLSDYSLYRVFYYTADPLKGTARNPLSKKEIKFGTTRTYSSQMKLIEEVENSPDVAVRRGTLVLQGWKLGRSAEKAMLAGTKQTVTDQDVVPRVKQVGVDMPIGLDIASLAFARREGLRVVLDSLGSSVRPELKLHADRVVV